MLSEFRNASTSVGWTPSVPQNTWETDSPMFTSANHSMNSSAFAYPPLTMEQLYCDLAEQTQTFPQTPTIQYQPQLVQPPSVLSFSPNIQNITPYPYHSYQEQQYHQPLEREQHLQLHLEAPENPEFPSLAISEVEGHASLDTLPRVPFQLIPSFEEMPIEPAFSEGMTEFPTLSLAAADVPEHQ